MDTSKTTRIQPGKRYMYQLAGSMVAYAVLLVLSIDLLKTHSFSQPLLTLVALIPVPPLFFVMYAVVRFVNSIDELQRRIHLEALAFAAGATAMLAVTLAFLENAGFPRVSAFWAFASVDIFWALALPFVKRRYA
ncbi:MAG: hypothetical protein NVS9B12_06450 [Vulcanimicrobiaceae bacterium]